MICILDTLSLLVKSPFSERGAPGFLAVESFLRMLSLSMEIELKDPVSLMLDVDIDSWKNTNSTTISEKEADNLQD